MRAANLFSDDWDEQRERPGYRGLSPVSKELERSQRNESQDW